MDRLPLDTIQCRERQGPATHARGPTITLAHVAGHGPACRPSRSPVSPVMASVWRQYGVFGRVAVSHVGCHGLQCRPLWS